MVLWNQKAEALHGSDEAEVLGRSIIDRLAPPESLRVNKVDFARVSHGSALSGARLVMRRDSEILRVSPTPNQYWTLPDR